MPKWEPRIVEWLENNCKGKTKYQLSEEIEEKFGILFTPAAISSYMGSHRIRTGLQPWKAHETKQKLPLNTERKKDGYIYVKTAQPNIWKLKHYLVLEESGITVQKNENVIFLDGNKENTKIENLYVVSLRILRILNTHYPNRPKNNPELMLTYIRLAQIKAAEKDRAKKYGGENASGTAKLVAKVRAAEGHYK